MKRRGFNATKARRIVRGDERLDLLTRSDGSARTTIATATILEGHVLDVLAKLPAGSVHSCMTSPPFWGLRNYNLPDQTWPDGWVGSLGLEPQIDLYLDHLVGVFDSVRRVLRDDSLCFVNLGDSYSGSWGNCGTRPELDDGGGGQRTKTTKYFGRTAYNDHRERPPSSYPQDGLKLRDLCGIPFRFALRMRAEGWHWRSTIIWSKGCSMMKAKCECGRDISYSGSVMPESVAGVRWQKNDAGELVLRRGSWRPTSAHDYIFMFAKSAGYWSDAIQEQGAGVSGGACFGKVSLDGPGSRRCSEDENDSIRSGQRNLRNVFVINPQSFPGAHFATWPERIVEPLIQCSTSEKGVCPECAAQWARVIDSNRTLGWRSTCRCGLDDAAPATILDPFCGSGTTLLVARKLGRHSIGVELSPEYAKMSRKRLDEYAPLFSTTNSGAAADMSAERCHRKATT